MSQASSVCSGTWLWTKRVQTSGSSPAATSSCASSQRLGPQLGRVLGDRQGVQVDDAVDGVVLVLVADPVRTAPR